MLQGDRVVPCVSENIEQILYLAIDSRNGGESIGEFERTFRLSLQYALAPFRSVPAIGCPFTPRIRRQSEREWSPSQRSIGPAPFRTLQATSTICNPIRMKRAIHIPSNVSPSMRCLLCLVVLGGMIPSLSSAADAKPLQVFILAGQSNMQGHAHVRTFEHIGMDPETKPLLAEMLGPDGQPKVCDRVWITSLGSADAERTGKLTAGFGAAQNGPKIGPEFTFGITMEKLTDAPILIIKTAWGGKSLNTDFRPPSAGPYVFNESQLANIQKQGKNLEAIQAEKTAATGVYYRLMIEHVKKVLGDIPRVVPDYDAAQGYELAGFVWFQGWNDMVDGGTYARRDQPGGYEAYSVALNHFIRDVRTDLQAPQLPFVIGVLGVGGPVELYAADQQRYKAIHQNFRDAMAAPAQLAEFQGNVIAVRTEKCWDQELTAAQRKDNALRQRAKKAAEEGKLSQKDAQTTLEKLRAEGLTERERQVLEKGISNFEFHYLGSAKILGRIGQQFAIDLDQLRRGRQRQK